MADDKDPETSAAVQLSELYPSSVELSKTSRGFSWTLKLRSRNGEEKDLINYLEELNEIMKTKFPSETGK